MRALLIALALVLVVGCGDNDNAPDYGADACRISCVNHGRAFERVERRVAANDVITYVCFCREEA